MSSLWTPGGEHPVPRPNQPNQDPQSQPSGRPDLGPSNNAFQDYDLGGEPGEELTHEEEAELRAMQEQLVSVPAAAVISNHVVNIFQLAMLHLFNDPPSLDEAALAIDAATAIVEKLSGRLGPDEPTLVDAVHQMRLAFVQVRNAQD
jgi:hypothetical protein